MNAIACLVLVSAIVCDVSHAASASFGAAGNAMAGAAGKAEAAASGAASGSASGSGAVSMSAVTDAAIQALVKIQQKMCTNPPPAADEAVKILKCCPMRKFFPSKICDTCRFTGIKEGGNQVEAMCKKGEADPKKAATDMWQCAVNEFKKLGNPVETLTPNKAFLQDSAACMAAGMGM